MRTIFLWVLFWAMCSTAALAGPVSDAAKSGDTTEIERLLASGSDANEEDPMASPLHWAAMNGHAAVVTVLLENGADIDAQSSMLGAPLHAASRFDRDEAIRALLAAGADPDVRDRDDFTPLMRAIVENRPEAAKALIDGGADVNAIGDAPGGTQIGGGPTIALQLSISFERDSITEMLRAAGAGPILPEVPDNLYELGDVDSGRELAYSHCEACHTIAEGDPSRTGATPGPPLIGIMGKSVASEPGFGYSNALRAHEGNWTPERFYEFVISPALTIPGTRMNNAPDVSAEMLADITAYFASFEK
jgi:cytochrome c